MKKRKCIKVNKDGHFIKHKSKYTKNIIKYSGAPSGKAYIGVNKEPLMPVKEGYGFQGVLLQDESRQFVQCHNCGEWFKSITGGHLKTCSGLSGREYKQKYGLYLTKGLISDEVHKKFTDNIVLNHYRNTKLKKW